MYKITPEMLREIAGTSTSKKVVDGLVEYLPEVMKKYEINTKLRIAHFLAQLAHESAHFRTLEEYASGQAYEGRADLGNVRRGDGHRYKGRGAIQLTGRYNYRKMGDILGIDLENNPELAATPKVSAYVAGEFWTSKNLNELADADNLKRITRKINGGYNGLQDRKEKLQVAKSVMEKAEKIVPQKKVDTVTTPKVVEPSQPKINVINVSVPNVKIDLLNNDTKDLS